MEKKYYKRLDLIRLLSCIGVFLYHLDILKGGYLAVCTFFVLTGYLSVVSAMSKDKFSIKEYYFSRFKKIYLPLLIVVLSSIAVVFILKEFNILVFKDEWINLKEESPSVLLGYNNFWQIGINFDYFTRAAITPFTHFWYIAILLQFEIVFPLIFVIFKKVGKKIGSIIPTLFFILLGLLSYTFFCTTLINNSDNINIAYYGTFTRAFSLMFGVALGFFHSFYKPIISSNKKLNTIIFYFYILLTIVMYFVMGIDFCSTSISMIVATIISMRLIDYSVVYIKKTNIIDKIVKSLSNVSYEIYLIQYPVYYIFLNIVINDPLKSILIIIITVIISYILHSALNIKKSKVKVISIILCLIFTALSIAGIYYYITAKDYKKEAELLKKQLEENSRLNEERNKQFLENKKNEEDEWKKLLEDYEAGEEQIKETVKNMSVVGIGDSIMELALNDLHKQFPNGYFDAKTNRTERELNGILQDLKDKNMLPDIIILNIGTNGSWSKQRKEEMLQIIGDRKIFWLNATKPDYAIFNDYLKEFAAEHDNVYIVDWISVAKDKTGILIYDGVHPTTPKGCKLYAETIYNTLYDYFLKEYNAKKEEMIKQHEEENNKKIVFVGNELLIGTYSYLQDDYSSSEFVTDKEFNYNSLKEKLLSKIEDKSLSHNVVLMLDKTSKIAKEEYSELFELLKDYKLYVVDLNNKLESNNDNVVVIDFLSELNKNDNYITFDNIHLTDEGNKALEKMIVEKVIK